MERGVIYLAKGESHRVRLVVALSSLRQHYTGPVTVFYPLEEQKDFWSRLNEDARLNVRTLPIPIPEYSEYSKKEYPFHAKSSLYRYSPYTSTIYMDVDTLVVGDFEEVWAKEKEFVAVQQNRTTANYPYIKNRYRELRQFLPPSLIDHALDRDIPMVNSGVFSFHRDASILEGWEALVHSHPKETWEDERILTLLLPHHSHRLLSDRYNCHPKWPDSKNDIRIWHYYGGNHVCYQSRESWIPAYEHALRENFLGLSSWSPSGDSILESYLTSQQQPKIYHPKFAFLLSDTLKSFQR